MFDSLFTINGTGYLCDVISSNNDLSIKLNVIHRFNAGINHSDDIWITSIVEDEGLKHILKALKKSLDMKKTVILEFGMQYTTLEHIQHGVDENDPNKFLFIKGKLLKIGKYFINGVNPLKELANEKIPVNL